MFTDFSLSQLTSAIRIADILDIAIMSVLIYALIVWFKNSKAVFVLAGLFIVGVIYNAAREFNLQLMATVFQGFFTVFLIAIIVIFQEEIKHMFERLAIWSIKRGTKRQKILHLSRTEVETLVRTLTDLAHDRIGAIIIIKGQDAIVRHINGGHDLNGELSEPLLKSIFDPHSIGHDGALIIENNRVIQFGCYLPLSKDLRKLEGGGGTRHAAALGLSEVTDALCLVVSEERGTISVAHNGEIEIISDPERLNLLLERFYDDTNPRSGTETGWEIFTHNTKEKLIAFFFTAALWFVYVYEGRLTYQTFEVPIEAINIPSQFTLGATRPSYAEVTFSGPHRYFYFVNEKRIKVSLSIDSMEPGPIFKSIQKSNIVYPEKLTFEGVAPGRVKFILLEKDNAPLISKKELLSN